MKNVKTVALSLMVVFSLVLLLAGSGVAQMQDMEGNVICVEVDEKGNTVAKEQFTECKGAFVLVGKDGKLYSVSGTEEQMKMMAKTPKKKVSGQVSGSQRAWVIYATPTDVQKGTEQTVKGNRESGSLDSLCTVSYSLTNNIKRVLVSSKTLFFITSQIESYLL